MRYNANIVFISLYIVKTPQQQNFCVFPPMACSLCCPGHGVGAQTSRAGFLVGKVYHERQIIASTDTHIHSLTITRLFAVIQFAVAKPA